MPGQVVARGARQCVWMTAGLIRYKLCDRGFDCESCLLDAGMRGELPDLDRPGDSGWCAAVVPDDRFYSGGHTWLKASSEEAGRWRMGLDAFAASIIGCATRLMASVGGRELRPGDPACLVDVGPGTISLGAPIACHVARRNPVISRHPDRALTDSYGTGWIVELEAADLTALLGLASPAAARDRFDLDLRRYCRSVAGLLLTDGAATARFATQRGDSLTDLRTLLGAENRLRLIRQFVH